MVNVDIIIPAYNAHKTLNRCLASIAAQNVIDSIKVLIVDDCSPDGDYHEYVDFWSAVMHIEAIRLEENGGPGVARQAGLDETDGDFVMFVDADDTLVSSFAVYQLLKGITENKSDICVGQFLEETEEGFVTHAQDLVWVFSKIYRRSAIERFLVRFNETRANEDVGFNTVLSNLTDKITYIPQTVYMWHWAASTITRNNHGEYTWAHGHRGYIENMIWAVQELRRRCVNKEIIRSLAVKVLCNLYFMHEDVAASAPWEAEESEKKIREFYDECIKPIVEEGALPFAYIHAAFGEVQTQTMANGYNSQIMPARTFRDYLRDLGFYDMEV